MESSNVELLALSYRAGTNMSSDTDIGRAVGFDPASQAAANLIDNALKYTPEGGRVTITAAVRDGEAVLEVSDTGPGVPPAEQPRVWERLYRADASRSQRGLGLGLSLVRAIVEAHGGKAEVSNTREGGAVFTLRLPVTTKT